MNSTIFAMLVMAPMIASAQVSPAPAQPVQAPTAVAQPTANPTPGVRQMDGTGPHGQGRAAKATPRKSNCPQGQTGVCPNHPAKATTPAK